MAAGTNLVANQPAVGGASYRVVYQNPRADVTWLPDETKNTGAVYDEAAAPIELTGLLSLHVLPLNEEGAE